MSRPAPRRNLRRLGLALAATVLVVLGAVTVLRVLGARALARAAERFEATVGPLDFEAYRPAPVPEADNAALPVLESFERLEAHGDLTWRREAVWLRQANRRAAADWSEEDRRRARSVLSAGRDVLEPLHRAAGRSGSSFRLDYSAGPEMEIPGLLHALEASDLLFAQARLAWREGTVDDAAAAVEALATLSRALEGESPLIFQLVGHTVEVLQYRAIQDALAADGRGPLDRRILGRLRTATDERPWAEALARALGGEGAFLYSLRPGGPYGVAVREQLRWPERFTYRWRGYGQVASGLDYYGRLAEAVPDRAFATLDERPDLLIPPREGGATAMIASFRAFVGRIEATESLRRLARAALDLASGGAGRGTLPSPPPADPLTGGAVVYEPAPDGSATLFVPGAEELWQAVATGRARAADEAPLFTWSVAAPETTGGPPA